MISTKCHNAPLVSIIVPVYNAAAYLDECIQSLQGQTCRSIEMILVDDGSKDDSLMILRRYEQEDARICVLTGPNAGASAARNRGIEAARGQYLYFFDADDIMESRAVETLLALYGECAEENNVRLAIGSYAVIENGAPRLSPQKALPGGILDTRDASDIVRLMRLPPLPDTKLYSAAVIRENALRWAPVRIGEDVNFYFRYLAACQGKVHVAQTLVARYRIVQGSVSHSPKPYILEIRQSLDQAEEYAKSMNASAAFLGELCNQRITYYSYHLTSAPAFPDAKQRLQMFNQFYAWMISASEQAGSYLSDDSKAILRKARVINFFKPIYLSRVYGLFQKVKLWLRARR